MSFFKKKTFYIIILLVFSFFSGLVLGNFHYDYKEKQSAVLTKNVVQTQKYMLKLNHEKIFLYKLENNSWEVYFEVIDIEVPALRPEDHEKLTRGIIADTKEELLHIIEDLSV